jgi:hypothetical protein
LWYKKAFWKTFSVQIKGILQEVVSKPLLKIAMFCYQQALSEIHLNLRRNREILAAAFGQGPNSGTLRHHPYNRGTL